MTQAATVFLGGKEYTILPMNLKTVIAVSPLLKSLEKVTQQVDELPEQKDFENIVQIIFLALKRGNPDITFDLIAEELDMRNMLIVLESIMTASGAVRRGGVKAGNQ